MVSHPDALLTLPQQTMLFVATKSFSNKIHLTMVFLNTSNSNQSPQATVQTASTHSPTQNIMKMTTNGKLHHHGTHNKSMNPTFTTLNHFHGTHKLLLQSKSFEKSKSFCKLIDLI